MPRFAVQEESIFPGRKEDPLPGKMLFKEK
jgi:hypothetical protein